MKIWPWGFIGLTLTIFACGSSQPASPNTTPTNKELVNASAQLTEATPPSASSACAPMATQVPLQPANDTELPFERLNFRPTDVDATDTTLTFRSKRYEFTFCKGDRTWGINSLEASPPEEEDYAEYFDSLGNPDYEAIPHEGQTYQARVRLEASWLGGEQAPNDLERVIFELLKPGDSEPLSKVLYTNKDIIERNLGASAGIPTVTQALAADNTLWLSIGFEQGEGASGITTIVQYQIDTDEIAVWQPTQLGNTQINDLAVTATDEGTTVWLGTQYSGEGNPYLPAQGLVAYRPTDNHIENYTVENSPLIGAIPTRLWVDGENLWAATANGVCEVNWANINVNDSWACWQFTIMADIPTNQNLYPSLLSDTPIEQLNSSETMELLWLADTDISTPGSTVRYEINYQTGLTAQLNQGADYYIGPEENPDDGYFWWPGQDWSWNGERFVRPLDQVAVNYVGGGPQGIGPDHYANYVADWQTMRGEFELLSLTPDTTEIKYYSAWIDGAGIDPWVTLTKATNASLDAVNPTDDMLTHLKQAAKN